MTSLSYQAPQQFTKTDSNDGSRVLVRELSYDGSSDLKRTTSSPPSGGRKLSFVGKVFNALSGGGSGASSGTSAGMQTRDSESSLTSDRAERSRSRGREFVATGRGGAGNMARAESVERAGVVRNVDGDERGREVLPKHAERVTHTGRGGAGNVRSPSRDPIQTIREELTEEQAMINARKAAATEVSFSTGRGGAGNIRKSPNSSVSPQRSGGRAQSRDPAPGRRYVSSGRGGAGNLHHANQNTAVQLENLEEVDRGRAARAVETPAIHSSGRGGAGNLTSAPEPHVTHPTHEVVEPTGAVHSSGRGGAGNIVNAHKDGEHHGLSGILHKVTHPGSH